MIQTLNVRKTIVRMPIIKDRHFFWCLDIENQHRLLYKHELSEVMPYLTEYYKFQCNFNGKKVISNVKFL